MLLDFTQKLVVFANLEVLVSDKECVDEKRRGFFGLPRLPVWLPDGHETPLVDQICDATRESYRLVGEIVRCNTLLDLLNRQEPARIKLRDYHF